MAEERARRTTGSAVVSDIRYYGTAAMSICPDPSQATFVGKAQMVGHLFENAES